MKHTLEQPLFMPMNRQEMQALGWEELDILLVSGDAYVDHPSFAMALLGRWLIAHGFRTGLIAQPRWQNNEDFLVMGRPRLFAAAGSGAIDSMLAHYTAFRKKRHDDAFTPGGQCGARPNRAVIVYANLLRQSFPNLPIIIGGIEASLRRLTHYDFWSDALRRPISFDAKCDLLVYGMGERAILDIAEKMRRGDERGYRPLLNDVRGTAFIGGAEEVAKLDSPMVMPSWEEINAKPQLLVTSALMSESHIRRQNQPAYQKIGERYIILNAPALPLSSNELDELYALPFARRSYPGYKEIVPALNMIRDSINSHRGCGGGCSFCSLALHQGRQIASRSRSSILNEAKQLTEDPDFKGSITDIGGPSANMWQAHCHADPTKCQRSSCLFPKLCKNLDCPQEQYVELLRAARAIPGIRHVRVASGLRLDLALANPQAVRAYTAEFTGGQLKVAPEHCTSHVLKLMRKPNIEAMEAFVAAFNKYSQSAHKEQYIIPYLMSAFPGCRDEDMRQLADWLKSHNWQPQQVQCFIPTPGTTATAMFFAECDEKLQPIYVARSDAERLRQHGFIAPKRAGAASTRGNRRPATGAPSARGKHRPATGAPSARGKHRPATGAPSARGKHRPAR